MMAPPARPLRTFVALLALWAALALAPAVSPVGAAPDDAPAGPAPQSPEAPRTAPPAGPADPKPPTRARFVVKVAGTGKPMILIPGLGSSGEVWDSTVDHFKASHECRVLTLAGFAGQPPALEEGKPFLESVRKDLAKYIREQKLDKPVIVGHSLGAFLAFWLAASEPDLVGPVVAVDGLPCFGALMTGQDDPEALKQQAEAMGASMAASPRAQFLQQQRRVLAGWIQDEKRLETAAKWGADSDQATFARAMQELIACDIRKDVAAIKSRVLLIGAYSPDMETSMQMTREAFTEVYTKQIAGIPDHTLAVSKNSKHFVMFDEPEWMWAEMEKFLAGKQEAPKEQSKESPPKEEPVPAGSAQ